MSSPTKHKLFVYSNSTLSLQKIKQLNARNMIASGHANSRSQLEEEAEDVVDTTTLLDNIKNLVSTWL